MKTKLRQISYGRSGGYEFWSCLLAGIAGWNLAASLKILLFCLLCVLLVTTSATSSSLFQSSPTACVCVCDIEASSVGLNMPKLGCFATEGIKKLIWPCVGINIKKILRPKGGLSCIYLCHNILTSTSHNRCNVAKTQGKWDRIPRHKYLLFRSVIADFLRWSCKIPL